MIFPFSLEMTSPATSGRQQIACVNLGSSSGHNFSITVQPILKKFTVWETAIRGLHFLFCKLLDIFALDPENGAQVARPYCRLWIMEMADNKA